jgi:hypothetical protein
MNIEDPVAYRFIMQDELYLLNRDRGLYNALPQPVTVQQPASFDYLGGHKKKFLIIVHYPEVKFITDNHLSALESVLTRIGLNIDDVSIFNRAHNPDIPFAQLIDFFTPQKLLLLGNSALPTGGQELTLNKPTQLDNCNTLFSFSFDEMMNNNEYKKAFWEQMKQL